MESIFERIERLEQAHGKPDPALLAKLNIKLGLRNSDGSGVVVGLTSKGKVIGYKKAGKGEPVSENWLLNNVRIPGLPEGAHITPALAVYTILNGAPPTPQALAQFEAKLRDLRETSIEPAEGELYYCGYEIRDLVAGIQKEDRFGFEEVVFLLLTGELPTRRDLEAFTAEIAARRPLGKAAQRILMNDSANEDQMLALHRAVSVMSLFDENPSPADIRSITRQCIDLIAKMPTIVAYNYQAMAFSRGQATGFAVPRPEMSTAESFLYMLNGKEPDRKLAKLMDLCLILHAEHGGGNNSTFTVRVVSSSQANTYMALTSGIASLSGHLHGGANEAVMRMMRGIKTAVRDWSDEDELRGHLTALLKGEAGDRSGKIYGLGHAVYTLSDPRAILLEEKARELAVESGREDEFELYRRVARIGCEIIRAEKGKRVSPNVDFYSGFVYETMGIPLELFTPIFSMARMAGWSAHRLEQLLEARIIRPAYASSVDARRPYAGLGARNS